jgi:DUF4097 and DUF4098 domain-containing protein YvlB
VHIVGHVHANNWGFGGAPEERVRAVVDRPPIEQTGNIIAIGKHADWIHNVSIDYDITMPRGTQLEASSGSGDLQLRDTGGPVKANTGSGSIDASGATGMVDLGTGSGEIRGELHAANDVKAHTGSGEIEVGGHPGSGWKVETGSGSVTINTGGGAHFTLDASTGSGSVHSDPPLAMHGSIDRHHVQGEIGGGGPTVRVSTGSGDIRIH